MSKRMLTAALFALTAGTLLSAQVPPSQPAAASARRVPRTAWGDPDLSGVYSNDD